MSDKTRRPFIHIPLEGEGLRIVGGVFFTTPNENALVLPHSSQFEITDCWFIGPDTRWWRRWRMVRAARKRQRRLTKEGK